MMMEIRMVNIGGGCVFTDKGMRKTFGVLKIL